MVVCFLRFFMLTQKQKKYSVFSNKVDRKDSVFVGGAWWKQPVVVLQGSVVAVSRLGDHGADRVCGYRRA
jgi:hypothetical protein